MKPSEVAASVRHIRRELRSARKAAGQTQQETADRVGALLERPSLTGAAIGQWENGIREPSILHLATWARALGRRLVLELVDEAADRVPMLVRPEDVETVRALGLLVDEDRDLVVRIVRRVSQGTT